mgnify:CR=1 FL=1
MADLSPDVVALSIGVAAARSAPGAESQPVSKSDRSPPPAGAQLVIRSAIAAGEPEVGLGLGEAGAGDIGEVNL